MYWFVSEGCMYTFIPEIPYVIPYIKPQSLPTLLTINWTFFPVRPTRLNITWLLTTCNVTVNQPFHSPLAARILASSLLVHIKSDPALAGPSAGQLCLQTASAGSTPEPRCAIPGHMRRHCILTATTCFPLPPSVRASRSPSRLAPSEMIIFTYLLICHLSLSELSSWDWRPGFAHQ